MKSSESINELAAALAKAQGAMSAAPKLKTNPHFRSKYADLPALWDTAREHLARNGLALLQLSRPAEGGVCFETVLTHSSGQWISDEGLFVPASKPDAQGMGSATTYARRYGMGAVLGLVSDEDDDGNGASKAAANDARPPAKPDAPKELLDLAAKAALSGMASYAAFWKGITPNERSLIGPARHADFKAAAAEKVEAA